MMSDMSPIRLHIGLPVRYPSLQVITYPLPFVKRKYSPLQHKLHERYVYNIHGKAIVGSEARAVINPLLVQLCRDVSLPLRHQYVHILLACLHCNGTVLRAQSTVVVKHGAIVRRYAYCNATCC
ncbi:hypothetical protein FKM82_017998 [Ascaphus truei]